ncbi:hypothetical protein D3C87_1832440 [compost metagenome]
MIVCAAGDQFKIFGKQFFSKNFGILHNIVDVRFKVRTKSFAESHSFACNNMLKRSPLNTRKDARVHGLGFFL